VARTSRWSGLSQTERRAERRRRLVRAAFELFGEQGEAGVTVRSVCRHSELNTRYFYESFADTDELLEAAYDVVVADLIAALYGAMENLPDDRARLAAGVRAVLEFSSEDARRGKILFTEARTNPVLSARRSMIQEELRKSVLDGDQQPSRPSRVAELAGAAMYSGAMAELAQQWLLGNLGTDVEPVVKAVVRQWMPEGV